MNKNKTLAQIDNDRQLEAFLKTWSSVIGNPIASDSRNSYSLAQRMLQRAKKIDISPNWIIGKCAKADNPLAYYMSITKPGDGQALPDESHKSFDNWLEELTTTPQPPRGESQPQLIGQTLADYMTRVEG